VHQVGDQTKVMQVQFLSLCWCECYIWLSGKASQLIQGPAPGMKHQRQHAIVCCILGNRTIYSIQSCVNGYLAN